MINKELKQEKNNTNENNIYNDENISLNISSVDNTFSQPLYCTKYNNKKNKIERTVLVRNKPKISFQRSAIINNGRKISSSKSKSKFLEQNQPRNNIKGKINKNLEYQCTIPISYHKKHKLNIIQLPKKKNKPKIYLSSKIMNLLKDSKSTKNTLFISDDSISKSNNNTYRSMGTINNNKNISKKFNKIPMDSSKAIKNYKVTIGSLIDNLKKILSPKQKENIFVKKPLSSRNTGFSIDRIPIKNNNIRGNSFQNNKPKYKFQKLEKPRVILKPTNIYVGRNKSQKNNLKMNNSDKYNSKSNIFFNGIYRNLNHEIGKVSYIYKKKK